MRRAVLISVLLFLVAGCFTNTAFVQVQPVPDAPSFTVLPANDVLDEVQFARRIEAALVSAGVIVLSPPPSAIVHKGTFTGNASGQVEAGAGRADAAAGWKTAQFVEYDGLESDYVVTTVYDGNGGGQIRISLRESQQVLTVFHARAYSEAKGVESQVRDAVDTILQGR